MAQQADMLVFALSGGLAAGAAIVFAGVWMVAHWRAIGTLSKAVVFILLAMVFGAAWVGLVQALPAALALGVEIATAAFVACSVLLGLFRIWRETWRNRPDRWSWWLLREIVRVLFWPAAIFISVAAALSTIVLFTTMQQGPQTDRLLIELGLVTAACWAIVMVGGVWARVRMPDQR